MMRVFRGPNGIRAGWRVAIFVALLLAFGAVIFLALWLLFPGPLYALAHPSASGQPISALAMNEAIVIISTVLATFTMSRIERRSVWSYGLRDRHGAAHFGAGALWGFVALSILLGGLGVSGFFAVDGRVLHGLAVARYALEWGVAFLAVGAGEELLFRGYLQSTLAEGIGFWPAAVLLSTLFGAGHLGNGGERLLGVVSAGSVGLVFCYALSRSGSLWWPIGFHAAWDWAQSYFYGTPDSGTVIAGHLLASHPSGPPLWSGGTVGPEGSILILPTLLLVAVVIRATVRRRASYESSDTNVTMRTTV
jgi:hypothetical protein